ncbi:hypothetical protein [Hymenobacter algoricola]|uniref:Uncharacterized protein n=1 Tax=Hymenobacter algoricola TaxID=486267 RepID=A0ABP7MX19_9BACT
MKTLTLLLFTWLGFAASLHAQQAPPPDSLRQHLDYLFAPLDKAQIPLLRA